MSFRMILAICLSMFCTASLNAATIFDDHFDDSSFTDYTLFNSNSSDTTATESGTVVTINAGANAGQFNRTTNYETNSQFDFVTPTSVTLTFLLDDLTPGGAGVMRGRFGYVGPSTTVVNAGMSGAVNSTGTFSFTFGDGTTRDILHTSTAIPGWSGASNPPITVTVNLDPAGWELIFSSDPGSPFSDTWSNGTNITSLAQTLDSGMSSLFIGSDTGGNENAISTADWDRLTMEAVLIPEPNTLVLCP